ncbi:MAG: hypothetical protein H8E26_13945 [FCB group bacterium]|nr:hypothetical protein [FCB group bacterium]MBL7029311.1 hypothetical protein [Candidatus Neomarinimicrobiota bacterium]MBL7122633.1 hypothetical protein [Candidatus Neomarinimicrobiota bacterium]
MLQPGDKIISGYGSINLLGSDSQYESYDIRHGGVSGMRAGFSYLGYRKGFEQGASISYGGGSGSYNSLSIGYDIRKVMNTQQSRPYRYGLQTEFNHILPEIDQRIQGGTVIQLRPYLMSATSELIDLYGGVHGIMSFGDMQSRETIYDWSSSSFAGENYDYSYNVAALGLGVSIGSELRFGEFLLQSQIDASYLSQQHDVNEDDYLYLATLGNGNLELEPMRSSGLYVSLGMAIGRAPKSSQSRIKIPVGYMDTSPSMVTPESGLKFDPYTGMAIPQKSSPTTLKFDPYTGESLHSKPAAFDPYTGLPLENSTPHSLLSPQERSILLMKGLKIVSLNRTASNALIQDVKSNGIVIYRESHGQSILETIGYENIRNIQFEGGKRGFKKGMNSAMISCGLCIALPLSASLLTGEGELFFMGLLTAPAVGLGTLVVSSLQADRYNIHFNPTPSQPTDVEYKKRVFKELIKLYVESGFPTYQLTPNQAQP